MSLSTTLKQLSIAIGVFRPAKWLSRLIIPSSIMTFKADIELYSSLLPRNALCFDIGANIGKKSEALLEIGARVVSFEPNPLVFPELRARCKQYKEWNAVQAAMGSGVAIAKLYVQEIHSQSSLAQDWWGGNIIASYYVPVVTLDSAIDCFGHPDYCKIDVEGWELEVLRGLTHSIPLLSFEFHLYDAGIRKTISCLEWLIQFGPSRVNITPAGSAVFHFKEWVTLEQFVTWFPGDLKQSLVGSLYGDIFVRIDTM